MTDPNSTEARATRPDHNGAGMSHCATCNCRDDEKPAQPATSSEWARRAALEAAAAAVRRSKEARTTVNRPHDEEQS